jgi:hypothetical protein
MLESTLSPSQEFIIWPLGDGVVVRRELEDVTSPPLPWSLLQQASGQIFKDDVNGLPSSSAIASELSPHSDLRISFNTLLVR